MVEIWLLIICICVLVTAWAETNDSENEVK